MKKAWIILIVLVVVGGIAAVIAGKMFLARQAKTVRVSMAEVERTDLTATVSAPGRVQAAASVDISAEVPGRIVEMAVAEGDSVRRGDLLLRLDDTRYRSQLQQNNAAMRTARANLDLARARLDQAKADLTRLERLRGSDLASEEALEAVQTEHRVRQAEVEARLQETARAEAALASARDDLEKTSYRAPIDGVVSRLNVEVGEIVVVGTMNNPGTVILSISDLGVMEVEADVDETDVVHVDVGQPATITVDAVRDVEYDGTVVAVGNSGRSSRTGDQTIDFEVRVQFDAPAPRLRPGMTADVEIRTETRSGVLAVPIQALVARSRGNLADAAADRGDTLSTAPAGADADAWRREIVEGVYRVEDGRAVFVPVEVGIADGTRIEVEGALEDGDRIVSGPYRVLRELEEGTRLRESGGEADRD